MTAVDLTISIAIHSQQCQGDSVRFTVTVKQGDRAWNYLGVATGSALGLLGGSQDLHSAFYVHRAKFAQRAAQEWHAQPESFAYSIDATNAIEGGGFVNNG